MICRFIEEEGNGMGYFGGNRGDGRKLEETSLEY